MARVEIHDLCGECADALVVQITMDLYTHHGVQNIHCQSMEVAEGVEEKEFCDNCGEKINEEGNDD